MHSYKRVLNFNKSFFFIKGSGVSLRGTETHSRGTMREYPLPQMDGDGMVRGKGKKTDLNSSLRGSQTIFEMSTRT